MCSLQQLGKSIAAGQILIIPTLVSDAMLPSASLAHLKSLDLLQHVYKESGDLDSFGALALVRACNDVNPIS